MGGLWQATCPTFGWWDGEGVPIYVTVDLDLQNESLRSVVFLKASMMLLQHLQMVLNCGLPKNCRVGNGLKLRLVILWEFCPRHALNSDLVIYHKQQVVRFLWKGMGK